LAKFGPHILRFRLLSIALLLPRHSDTLAERVDDALVEACARCLPFLSVIAKSNASCYPSHDSNFKRAVFTSPVHLDRIVTFLRFDVFNGCKRAECDVARVDG
jgi:hypothetical protein